MWITHPAGEVYEPILVLLSQVSAQALFVVASLRDLDADLYPIRRGIYGSRVFTLFLRS